MKLKLHSSLGRSPENARQVTRVGLIMNINNASEICSPFLLDFTSSNALPGHCSEKAFNECPGVSNVFPSADCVKCLSLKLLFKRLYGIILKRMSYFWPCWILVGIELIDSFVQRAITKAIKFAPTIALPFPE